MKNYLARPIKVASSLIAATTFAFTANAATYTFTAEDLSSYISQSDDPLDQLIADQLLEELNSAKISLNDGELLYENRPPNKRIEDSCSLRVDLKEQHEKATIHDNTVFTFTGDGSISSTNGTGKLSIGTTIDLDADLYYRTRVKTQLGYRITINYGFGKKRICNDYANDSAYVTATANAKGKFALRVTADITSDSSSSEYLVLQAVPNVKLTGNISSLNNVNVDIKELDLAPSKPVEKHLESELTASKANSKLASALAKKEDKLRDKLAKKVLSDSEYALWVENQRKDPIIVTYKIPLDNQEIYLAIAKAIYDLNPTLPVSREFIEDHKRELAYAAVTGDDNKIKEILSTSLACQLSEPLLSDMPALARPAGTEFVETSYADWCAQTRDNGGQNIGNPDSWNGGDASVVQLPWTLTPGSQFNIGAVPTNNKIQPYMQKNTYKSVNVTKTEETFSSKEGPQVVVTEHTCRLEMRVYKNDLAAQNLKPLMAIHGGSWMYRGFGFFGMESMISNMTEKGFVVFAPFYRLVGDSDAPEACNEAKGEDLIQDIEDALTWVENNMQQYGASGKVHLFGQSAGAHLSTYLAAHHPTRIEKAMLMYPPADLSYLVEQAQAGVEFDPKGVKAIELFFDKPVKPVYRYRKPGRFFSWGRWRRYLQGYEGGIKEIDLNDPFVEENALPSLVQQTSGIPPLNIIHGVADSLVPANQSVRLCNALSGASNLNDGVVNADTPFVGGNPAQGEYEKTYQCGNNSQMTLLQESEHVLDMCIDGVFCPTGSSESAATAGSVISNAYNWLAQ